MIGSLGDIIFEVSEDRALTFSELSFSSQASFTEHKIIGADPLIEFTGFNARTCNIKITLDQYMGISPAKQLDEITKMFREHNPVVFVLDGALVGRGDWVIEGMNVQAERHDHMGGIERASVSLSLKEYL